MKGIFWNCHGLRDPKKSLSDLISEKALDFCGFIRNSQEGFLPNFPEEPLWWEEIFVAL